MRGQFDLLTRTYRRAELIPKPLVAGRERWEIFSRRSWPSNGRSISIEPEPETAAEAQIASILEVRGARAEVLGTGLFGDPAWDILLQLYAASLGGRSLKLSELVIAAPPSTIARWIGVLNERDLIFCELDSLNPAELRIELAVQGHAKMSGLFRKTRHLQLIG